MTCGGGSKQLFHGEGLSIAGVVCWWASAVSFVKRRSRRVFRGSLGQAGGALVYALLVFGLAGVILAASVSQEGSARTLNVRTAQRRVAIDMARGSMDEMLARLEGIEYELGKWDRERDERDRPIISRSDTGWSVVTTAEGIGSGIEVVSVATVREVSETVTVWLEPDPSGGPDGFIPGLELGAVITAGGNCSVNPTGRGGAVVYGDIDVVGVPPIEGPKFTVMGSINVIGSNDGLQPVNVGAAILGEITDYPIMASPLPREIGFYDEVWDPIGFNTGQEHFLTVNPGEKVYVRGNIEVGGWPGSRLFIEVNPGGSLYVDGTVRNVGDGKLTVTLKRGARLHVRGDLTSGSGSPSADLTLVLAENSSLYVEGNLSNPGSSTLSVGAAPNTRLYIGGNLSNGGGPASTLSIDLGERSHLRVGKKLSNSGSGKLNLMAAQDSLLAVAEGIVNGSGPTCILSACMGTNARLFVEQDLINSGSGKVHLSFHKGSRAYVKGSIINGGDAEVLVKDNPWVYVGGDITRKNSDHCGLIFEPDEVEGSGLTLICLGRLFGKNNPVPLRLEFDHAFGSPLDLLVYIGMGGLSSDAKIEFRNSTRVVVDTCRLVSASNMSLDFKGSELVELHQGDLGSGTRSFRVVEWKEGN